jgi:Spy/CpxP family protein refolding chaperone
VTLKSKLTTLSVVAAILMTSSFAAFASSEVKGDISPQKFQEREFDYETVSTRHLEMTGEELTEEMFAQRQEAHELMQSGDKEAAEAILDELGINPLRMGEMNGRRGLNSQRGMFMQNLTDEQREVFKDAHELKLTGDIEGAKELIKAAGLEKPKHQERPGEFRMEK